MNRLAARGECRGAQTHRTTIRLHTRLSVCALKLHTIALRASSRQSINRLWRFTIILQHKNRVSRAARMLRAHIVAVVLILLFIVQKLGANPLQVTLERHSQ